MYSSSLVESLICYCAEHFITEVPVPLPHCNSDKSCETTGKCLVNLVLEEFRGSLVERYDYECVSDSDSDQGDGISRIDTICALDAPSSTQVVLCCNNTDFCNKHLNPRALLASLSAMSPSPPTSVMVLSPTSTHSGGHGNAGTECDHNVAVCVVYAYRYVSVKSFLKRRYVMVVYEE